MRLNTQWALTTLVHVLSFASRGCGLGLGPLGSGSTSSNLGDPYGMQDIKSGYQVFRNVKDFGAKGDGSTDDTDAINAAISSEGRCGEGTSCQSTTRITPSEATVYFPKGTYVVSKPIMALNRTQLIGDAKTPPTILASSDFDGSGMAMAVIDAGASPDGRSSTLYRSVRSIRNFVVDLRQIPPQKFLQGVVGIRWHAPPGTSLMNMVFHMSTTAGSTHQGIRMESGSGGFIGDLVFNGGKFGVWAGNSQFMARNVTVNNAQTAVLSRWESGWTFEGININDCQVGFDLLDEENTESTTQPAMRARAINNAVVTNTTIFIRKSGQLPGSVAVQNAKLDNVKTAVGGIGGTTVLAGGTKTIESWGQGDVYKARRGFIGNILDLIFGTSPEPPSHPYP